MIVSRIAPTPSGFLHKGNAFNFLLTWLMVRKNEGVLHLRIDDIDQGRVRKEYIEDIFLSLQWLGITWDHGPKDSSEFETTYSQVHHLKSYQEFLEELKNKDRLFACPHSRKDIRAHSSDGVYPDSFKSQMHSFDTEGVAWRIHTSWPLTRTWTDLYSGETEYSIDAGLKDAILRKKDGMPSYQVTSVVDDIRMGITLIVRGEDLLGSTVFQQWLMELFGVATSIQFYHHPLLLDSGQEKLSKSTGATALFQQYKSGKSPEALIREFARWMGWTDFEGKTAGDLLSFVQSGDLLI